MSDPVGTEAGAAGPGEAIRVPEARAASMRLRTLPWFWIVPALSILIGIGMIAKSMYDEGPAIHIELTNAEGIEAGKTRMRYKNVEVGSVTGVRLADDDHSVIVTVRVTRSAAHLLVSDARFWVARPRFYGGQLQALGTLISGPFIAMDKGHATTKSRDFVALDAPPPILSDDPGREFILNASALGSLDIGAPVYYRRLAVGQVSAFALNPDGSGVTVRVFVRKPYDAYVTQNTRFWNASGVDVALDSSGVHMNTESLLSILAGGVAFAVPDTEPPGAAAASDTAFTLFHDQARALRKADAPAGHYIAYFTDTVHGLAVGTPVDLRGITVGEVRAVSVEFDPDHARIRFKVNMDLYPERLGAAPAGGAAGGSVIDHAIAHGLYAQIRSASLITGQRLVALDFSQDRGTRTAHPTHGEIPTLAGDGDDLQQSLASIAKKLDHVPVQAIVADLRDTMHTLQRTLDDTDKALQQFNGTLAPQLAAALAQAREGLAAATRLLASDSPLQEDAREALRQLGRTAASLRELSDTLERHPESLLRGRPADTPEKGQ